MTAAGVDACGACLRRSALLARLSGHIERARHERRRIVELLALEDARLIAALAGRRQAEIEADHAAFDEGRARARLRETGLEAICRHAPAYPLALTDLSDRPAVLHVAGRRSALAALAESPAVAIVGARRAGADGLEIARALARGLAVAGVPIISGMALGIDSAAHAGAVEVGGPTVAVLAGGADVIYPSSKRRLYAEIRAAGCAVSEMPPGFTPLRWCFPARNRTIAGLAQMTIVVEAAERSGSLITTDLAQELGRSVAAVPGPVTSPRAAGTNALLRDGAILVRHAQDALDEVLGVGVATATSAGDGAAALDPELRVLLSRVEEGDDTLEALARDPAEAQHAMSALAELELRGLLRRGAGGRYVRLL